MKTSIELLKTNKISKELKMTLILNELADIANDEKISFDDFREIVGMYKNNPDDIEIPTIEEYLKMKGIIPTVKDYCRLVFNIVRIKVYHSITRDPLTSIK